MPTEEDEDHDEHSHKLRASKYENTGIIWFATNSQGEQPVLFVPVLFISLVSAMIVILYYFYNFQAA